MKKIIAILLTALLVCGCTAALAQDALTVDELTNFWDALLTEALGQEAVEPEEAEDGLYAHEFDQITLISEDAQLTESSRIQYAELRGGMDSLTDGRGIGPGSTLKELLAAYPLDNLNLSGSYDEFALYISGALPDTVNYAAAQRDGSHVLQVEHNIITPDGEEAEHCFIGYTLDNNIVTHVYSGVVREALTDAEMDIADCSSLQENRAYSAYTAEQPEPLAREDLLFTGKNGVIDFVGAAEKDLTAILGQPAADNWEQHDNVYMRTMEWEGVTAALAYDANKEQNALAALQVYGDALEGPRGVHMDDTVDDVLARFPQEDGEQLYGEGETAPYGLMEITEEGLTAHFGVQTAQLTAVLSLDFVDDALWVITCEYK